MITDYLSGARLAFGEKVEENIYQKPGLTKWNEGRRFKPTIPNRHMSQIAVSNWENHRQYIPNYLKRMFHWYDMKFIAFIVLGFIVMPNYFRGWTSMILILPSSNFVVHVHVCIRVRVRVHGRDGCKFRVSIRYYLRLYFFMDTFVSISQNASFTRSCSPS